MKRSARPVKPNSKYFDDNFKSPRLDLMMKEETPAITAEGDAARLLESTSLDAVMAEVSTKMAKNAVKEMTSTLSSTTEWRASKSKTKAKATKNDGENLNESMTEESSEEKPSLDSDSINESPVSNQNTSTSRPTRQIKPNSKYQDSTQFMLRKMTLTAAEVKAENTKDPEDMEESSFSTDKLESQLPSESASTIRPGRQIKPNSKYTNSLEATQQIQVSNSIKIKPETTELVEKSLTSPCLADRPSRQPKPNRKYLDSRPMPKKSEADNAAPSTSFKESAASSSSSPHVAPSTSTHVTSTAAKVSTRTPKSRGRPPRKSQVAAKSVDQNISDIDCDSGDDDPKRPCGKSGCSAVAPMCFAGTSERCTGNKYTSRWNHISEGEHYCNECFEYFRGRRGFSGTRDGGLQEYETWKSAWSVKAQRPASISGYLVEQVLPYWAHCRDCGKWRQLSRRFPELTSEFLASFTCSVLKARGTKIKLKDESDACATPEDKRIQYVRSCSGFFPSRPICHLRQSLAAPFLTKYYPDRIGLSPIESTEPISKAEKKKLCPYVVPWCKEGRPIHAFGAPPDAMLDLEITHFPDLAQESPQLYLGIRNLALAVWALNPKEWVTAEKVENHLICRGLARVGCVELLPRILTFLTRHGFINQGLLTPKPWISASLSIVSDDVAQKSVLVIGAGISGLAAARCLHSYGLQVTVLEVKSRVGGRVSNQTFGLGIDVHSGQLLSGCWNNPLALIAYQAGIDLYPQPDLCPLLTSQGQLVPEDLDRRIEFHYNAILDIVSDWRRGKKPEADVPLSEKFKELHEEFIRETQEYFSETTFSHREVSRLVNFYLSNLEFACGCCLDRASALFWDQNEDLPQLGGQHMQVAGGLGSILAGFSEGLDIKMDCQVTDVNYTGKVISVNSSQGIFKADKVIMTVPLSVLKKNQIRFEPALPEVKVKAIQSLGAGRVEKVTLQFSKNFWSEKIQGHSLFGHIPECKEHMGLFGVFYSHHDKKTDTFILTSNLVGNGLVLMEGKTDKEVVDKCVSVLQSLFPEQVIPPPIWSSVSHWSSDPHTGMAYSHVPVGASGETYDEMAAPVEAKLYFAGEATNRQFPQTTTGAYLSGIREAWNIIEPFTS